MDTTTPIVDFLNRVTAALGITATVEIDETADGPRLNLTGDDAELLVRHRGEPLKALQHVVDMSYGRSLEGEKRVFVDALAYRKGKDIEMRKMAQFLAAKVKETGLDQQMGPLNPYERRIVHMAVAELEGLTSFSEGEGHERFVTIAPGRKADPS
jgi:spoIIIJ-associated protein